MFFVEHLRDEAHLLVAPQCRTVRNRHSGAFLSAMLERVEREKRGARHVLSGSEYAADSAGIVQRVLAALRLR